MTTQPSETANDRRESHPGADLARTGSSLGRRERAAVAVLGGGLLVRGLRRRSLRGLAMTLVGGWLVLRAFGTERRIEGILRSRTPLAGERPGRRGPTDAPAVSRSITIGRPADELYDAWRDPDQFSAVMGHFAEVTATDGDRLHWTVHGPLGRDVSWETRVVEADPGAHLRWETTAGAPVPNEGSVRFRPAPGDRGTQVALTLDFDPPGGALGNAALQRLDVVPEALAGTALRRFKALVESGEIPSLEANPSARGPGDLL